eukprot:gene1567-12692_t
MEDQQVLLFNEDMTTHDGLIEFECNEIPMERIPIKPKLKIHILCPFSIQWFRLEENRKVLVCQQLNFTPKEKDIGFKFEILCILISSLKKAKKSFITEEVLPFPKILMKRELKLTESEVKDEELKFRIINYNIQHPSRVLNNFILPPYSLEENYRNILILEELKLLDGDIICLQEIFGAKNLHFFEKELKKLNFKLFKADDLFEFENLIFINENKFKGLKKFFIDFDKSIMKLFKNENFEKTKKFALILEIERIKDGKSFLLINSQFSNQNSENESTTLIQGLKSILKEEFDNSSMIFCLDLNRENTEKLFKQENFKSSYEELFKNQFQYLKYSTLTTSNDYVFYKNMNLISGLEINKEDNYPSELFCSDHVSMVFEFE